MSSDTLVHSIDTKGAERIAELWPDLPPHVREELLAIAEAAAASADDEVEFELTPEEMASLERSRADFAAGRTMTSAEARASIESYFDARAAWK